jgi:beta-phosphoglucomutase-like phosphatase (HAD superfamily)
MISRLIAATATAVLIGTATVPTSAWAEMAKKKELTPQQQKMKDCSAKGKDEKAAKKVSGKKAHDEFMSSCLKG